MPNPIKKIKIIELLRDDRVRVEMTFEDGPPQKTDVPTSAFGITDRQLAFQPGNVFRGKKPYPLTQFAAATPGQNGNDPDIDRNPYNFVALADARPWTQQPEHANHAQWLPKKLHGEITFTLETRSPIFTPMGDADREASELHFFRLRKRGEEFQRYAIPGSSIKGALRAMVEAVANDRLGIFSSEHKLRIPYRRQASQAGSILSFEQGDLELEEHDRGIGAMHRHDDLNMFLLARVCAPEMRQTRQRNPQRGAPNGNEIRIKKEVVEQYLDNLDHPHYQRYLNDRVKEEMGQADRTNKPSSGTEWQEARDNRARHPYYRELLSGTDWPDIKGSLADLAPENNGNTDIFFIGNPPSSFGKNAYFLWPSKTSVEELCKPFINEPQGLKHSLGLADLIFGFAAPHGENSHPFQGKVRMETAWGPKAISEEDEKAWSSEPQVLPDNDGKGIKIQLAPLTSPATHAKSQPLYLQPTKDGKCQTYSDDSTPQIRGRKFYWKQRSDNGIWKHHRFDKLAHAKVKGQCPPPLCCLQDVKFRCRLEFENLSPEELGCLLFVLQGNGNGTGHTLAFGMGKPRGFGCCQVTDLTVTREDPRARYSSLTPSPSQKISESQHAKWIQAFQEWCEKMHADHIPFQDMEHIRDFLHLHSWPSTESVRYYPPNFDQYNPSFPRNTESSKRIKAMSPAHNSSS